MNRQMEPDRTRRIPLLVIAGLVAVALMAPLLLTVATASASGQAQAAKTANVIVQFDDSNSAIRAIDFTDSISGVAALQQSGFDFVATEAGAVCSIEGVGCPEDDCFCKFPHYWGYNYWDGTAWQSYSVGAGSSMITETGAIEGFRWGESGDSMISATLPLAAHAGLNWIHGVQDEDGGFGAMNPSVEAAFAIGANREDASDWRSNNDAPSLANYLMADAAAYADNNAGTSGRTTVALAATNVCWPSGAPGPASYYSPTSGTYHPQVLFQTWAMLGALAGNDVVSQRSLDALKDAQKENGGWAWLETSDPDTNTTALVIQTLIAAGESISATEVIGGLAFLKSSQNADGGFPYDPESTVDIRSDTNSTAYVIQGLLAAGEDPSAWAWQSVDGHSPIDFLLGMQLNDGSFEWQSGGTSTFRALATMQAVTALLGGTQPIGLGLKRCPNLYSPYMNGR